MTSNNALFCFFKRANASRICASSPSCVLPANHTGRCAPQPRRTVLAASMASGGKAMSNFKLPVTSTASARAPK